MTISQAVIQRQMLKLQLKDIENKIEELNQFLIQEVGQEVNKTMKVEGFLCKVIQRKTKVFDIDKVMDLVGDDRIVKLLDKKTGELKKVNLYTPSATAIKEYLSQKAEKGELSSDQVQLYKSSFYEKVSDPFIVVE